LICLQPKVRCLDIESQYFNVSKCPLVIDSEYYKNLVDDTILGHAIVRTDTNEILSRVSNKYAVITHKEVITFAEKLFNNFKLKYSIFDINTGGYNSNRLYVNYLISDMDYTIKCNDNTDIYTPFIQVTNSYDADMRFNLRLGLYRLRCHNYGLLSTKQSTLCVKRHTRNKVSLYDINLDVEKWKQANKLYINQLYRLSNMKLDRIKALALLRKLISKPDFNKFNIFDLLTVYTNELGNNYYALYNALTAFYTHIHSNSNAIHVYENGLKVQQHISDKFLGL